MHGNGNKFDNHGVDIDIDNIDNIDNFSPVERFHDANQQRANKDV